MKLPVAGEQHDSGIALPFNFTKSTILAPEVAESVLIFSKLILVMLTRANLYPP